MYYFLLTINKLIDSSSTMTESISLLTTNDISRKKKNITINNFIFENGNKMNELKLEIFILIDSNE